MRAIEVNDDKYNSTPYVQCFSLLTEIKIQLYFDEANGTFDVKIDPNFLSSKYTCA
jgi:hypothetical protein